MTDARLSDQEVFPPSYFANAGQPCCSIWGKSEIEWLALAYVQALANDGDTWKRLSRKQTHGLLTEDQRKYVHGMLMMDIEPYERWFKMISSQLSDADGAFAVRGFWPRRPE